ncbi:MAG: molybdopterin-guanine dinucleotide biosynthesis protein B [Coriobacteriaceae bacterium]|nr:molybdopterin-guanine dinucleotide biosynthesis protein B [Coriobacteriaceae bacterium]
MSEPTAIPVVAFVGKSDSGKTTVVEGVIRALVARGVRVACVKRHTHDDDLDVPGKDSWRHRRAGAAVAMVSSSHALQTVRTLQRERTLDELAAEAAPFADILVAEGFKSLATERIEVSRMARSDALVSEPVELVALVTDNAELACEGVPRFGLDEHDEIASFVVDRYLDEGE